MKTKTYQVILPIWKQGDDFAFHLKNAEGNAAGAFQGLRHQYEEAARICGLLENTFASHGDKAGKIEGDTHMIVVRGDPTLLEPLVQADLLDSSLFDEDEDFEDDELEDDDA